MARELLSSRIIYRILKFGMPIAFIGFGVLLGAAVIAKSLGAPVVIEGDSPGIRIMFVVVVPLAAVALTAWLWDLKYVELDGNRLLVSGVRRRIVVPLTDVAAIKQSLLEPGNPIYVELKVPGEFGGTFSFIASPPVDWTRGHQYPLVERLRGLAGIHEGAPSDSFPTHGPPRP